MFLAQQKRQSVNHTDRRVKRTKKALRDALFELLESKTINQVTVTELTTLADVNRATFYFYYTDLNDMVNQIQNETYQTFMNVLSESIPDISTIEGFAEYANRLLVFCKEHETLCKFIINNDANNKLYKKMQTLMMKHISNSADVFADNNPAKYSTSYVLSGITGILTEWINDGMTIPTEELAIYLANVYFNGSNKTNFNYMSYKSANKK